MTTYFETFNPILGVREATFNEFDNYGNTCTCSEFPVQEEELINFHHWQKFYYARSYPEQHRCSGLSGMEGRNGTACTPFRSEEDFVGPPGFCSEELDHFSLSRLRRAQRANTAIVDWSGQDHFGYAAQSVGPFEIYGPRARGYQPTWPEWAVLPCDSIPCPRGSNIPWEVSPSLLPPLSPSLPPPPPPLTENNQDSTFEESVQDEFYTTFKRYTMNVCEDEVNTARKKKPWCKSDLDLDWRRPGLPGYSCIAAESTRPEVAPCSCAIRDEQVVGSRKNRSRAESSGDETECQVRGREEQEGCTSTSGLQGRSDEEGGQWTLVTRKNKKTRIMRKDARTFRKSIPFRQTSTGLKDRNKISCSKIFTRTNDPGISLKPESVENKICKCADERTKDQKEIHLSNWNPWIKASKSTSAQKNFNTVTGSETYGSSFQKAVDINERRPSYSAVVVRNSPPATTTEASEASSKAIFNDDETSSANERQQSQGEVYSPKVSNDAPSFVSHYLGKPPPIANLSFASAVKKRGKQFVRPSSTEALRKEYALTEGHWNQTQEYLDEGIAKTVLLTANGTKRTKVKYNEILPQGDSKSVEKVCESFGDFVFEPFLFNNLEKSDQQPNEASTQTAVEFLCSSFEKFHINEQESIDMKLSLEPECHSRNEAQTNPFCFNGASTNTKESINVQHTFLHKQSIRPRLYGKQLPSFLPDNALRLISQKGRVEGLIHNSSSDSGELRPVYSYDNLQEPEISVIELFRNLSPETVTNILEKYDRRQSESGDVGDRYKGKDDEEEPAE